MQTWIRQDSNSVFGYARRDTYNLNCSGFLPNGGTSSQTNESDTKHTPSDPDLKIRYDKFKDVTYVSTNDLMIAGVDSVANKRPQQLTMVLSYFCHGNTQNCSPRTMELVFVGKTSFWEYKSTHDLVFILDGRRMFVPRPDWEGKVMSADDLREYMDCQISTEAIRRLAAAREVEGELGFTAFKLNQDHLSAFAHPPERRSQTDRGVTVRFGGQLLDRDWREKRTAF